MKNELQDKHVFSLRTKPRTDAVRNEQKEGGVRKQKQSSIILLGEGNLATFLHLDEGIRHIVV